MSKSLKKVLVAGATLLMFASVGAGANNVNVSARHVRSNRMTKVNRRHDNKANAKQQPSQTNRNTQQDKNNKRNIKVNKRSRKFNKRTNKKRNRKRVTKRNKLVRNNNKKNRRQNTRRINRKLNKKRINKRNKRQVKRLNKKAHRQSRRNFKRNKRNKGALKARFRRSNSRRLLKRSGYIDLMKYESNAPDIMNKYAPNDRRAVVPKNLNVKKVFWLQGRMMQRNPTVYQYSNAKRGWVVLR